MSHQLRQAMEEILRMPYYVNENARSGSANYGHEAALAVKLTQAGFKEDSKDRYPKLKKSLLKKWAESGNDRDLRSVLEDMEQGSFILQPAGTQGFPDILIKDHGARFVALEGKSGRNGLCPMWNDNLPKPNGIYVLSSGKADQTTAFLGRDVMNQKMLISQVKMIQELKTIVAKYSEINRSLDEFNRGWDIKFRPQNFQSGGKEKTNYFTHANRKTCELNVLEFASE